MRVSGATKVVAVICGAAMTLTACGQSSSDQYNWKDTPAKIVHVGLATAVDVHTYADGSTPEQAAREQDPIIGTPAPDSCWVDFGSTLTATKKSGDDLLATYHSSSSAATEYDAPCNDGAQVVVDLKDFESMPAEYQDEKKAIADSKKAANYLLAHQTVDSAVRVVGDQNNAYQTPIGKSRKQCSLDRSDYVRSLGSINGQTLVGRVAPEGEYAEPVPPTAFNTHCYGEQFLVDSGDFNKMSPAPKDLVFQK